LPGEGVDDFVDVLCTQAVLVAVLDEALAGVHHEDAFAARSAFLVQHDDAGGDAGAVEQVGRQADDALDEALFEEARADASLCPSAEQHAVRQDDSRFASALEALEHVQQKGIVPVFLGRCAVFKAAIQIVGGVQPAGPGLGGKRRIRDDEIEGSQPAVLVLEVGAGQGVGLPDFRRGAVVQHHVHARQRRSGVVHLLAVQRQVQPGAVLGFVVGLEQQRAGAAGGVINALIGIGGLAKIEHQRHRARDFCRGVELPFALAGLGGEMPHQVLIGVAQQVVAAGTVAAEVQPLKDRDQLGQAIHHLLALAQLLFIVEVGDVDRALQAFIGIGKTADQLVDLVADLLVVLELHHVGEAAALGNFDQCIRVASVLIGNVFDEQQDEHVVLVLTSVHATAKLVARFPEG
jgi:hypothetical protein